MRFFQPELLNISIRRIIQTIEKDMNQMRSIRLG